MNKLYLLYILFLISCIRNEVKHVKKIYPIYYESSADSIRQINFSRTYFPEYIKKYINDNKLDIIDNGFNSFQLRIWYGYGKILNTRFFLIKIDSLGKVYIENYLLSDVPVVRKMIVSRVDDKKFELTGNKKNELIQMINVKKINNYPKNQLYIEDVSFELPGSYFIEIAQPNSYIHYYYSNFKIKRYIYPYIKLLDDFIKYLDRNFGFYDLNETSPTGKDMKRR